MLTYKIISVRETSHQKIHHICLYVFKETLEDDPGNQQKQLPVLGGSTGGMGKWGRGWEEEFSPHTSSHRFDFWTMCYVLLIQIKTATTNEYIFLKNPHNGSFVWRSNSHKILNDLAQCFLPLELLPYWGRVFLSCGVGTFPTAGG